MHRKLSRETYGTTGSQIVQQNYAFIMALDTIDTLDQSYFRFDAVKMFVAQAIGTLIASICLIIGASVLLLITNWQLVWQFCYCTIIGGTFFYGDGEGQKLFAETQKLSIGQ